MMITTKRRYTRTVISPTPTPTPTPTATSTPTPTPTPTTNPNSVLIAITLGGGFKGGLVTGSAFDAFTGNSPYNVAGYGGTSFDPAQHQNFTYTYTTGEEITCLYALNITATFASWSLETGCSFKSGYSSTSNPTVVVMNTSGSKQIGCRFN
jgi:hypothetical protein